MDILRIRSFVTVARLGNVTRAAEALHLTQPAVTGHIRTMEQELGVALFQRTANRIELTKAGTMLNNATFRPFLVYSLVAAIYFALCFPLTLWSRSLEARLDGSR